MTDLERERENARASNAGLLDVTEQEIVAAKRLLLLLAREEGSRRPESKQSCADRRTWVGRASRLLRLRKRREAIFGKAMFGEPPFDMLLNLYVHEETEARMPVSRLAELASVPRSTVLRWLDYLVGHGLVAREPGATYKRKLEVFLTDTGRKALDELFSGGDLL